MTVGEGSCDAGVVVCHGYLGIATGNRIEQIEQAEKEGIAHLDSI